MNVKKRTDKNRAALSRALHEALRLYLDVWNCAEAVLKQVQRLNRLDGVAVDMVKAQKRALRGSGTIKSALRQMREDAKSRKRKKSRP